MGVETWGALIGVVVGAVLGGGAQIVDSHLSGRRTNAATKREVRRSVYVEFLRACSQLHSDAIIVRSAGSEAGRNFADLLDSVGALQSAMAELSLVSPKDTEEAAQVTTGLHIDLAGKNLADESTNPLRVKAVTARDMFVLFAQRDLGFGDFRRPSLKERLRTWRSKKRVE